MLHLMAKAIRRAEIHPGKHTIAYNGSLEIPCSDLCADTELCDFWMKFVITGRQRAWAENSCNIIMPQLTSTKGHPKMWKLILQLKPGLVPLSSVCVTTLPAKVAILLDKPNHGKINFKMPYSKLLDNKSKSPHSK
jgi:hypothetical protein